MGSGLPSAIGAKEANSNQDVVVITRDGGLLMCLHELHTLADEDIDVTVVVLDNNDYAIISGEGSRSYRTEKGEYGWAETPVSLLWLLKDSESTLSARRITNEIVESVSDAINSDGPTLVEIPTGPYEPQASVWRMIEGVLILLHCNHRSVY